MYLVITSVAHLFSILPIIKYYNTHTCGYINTIILSTTLSILYHTYEESNRVINILDYLCALIWFLYDVYMGYTYTNTNILFNIIFVNATSLIVNIYIYHIINTIY